MTFAYSKKAAVQALDIPSGWPVGWGYPLGLGTWLTASTGTINGGGGWLVADSAEYANIVWPPGFPQTIAGTWTLVHAGSAMQSHVSSANMPLALEIETKESGVSASGMDDYLIELLLEAYDPTDSGNENQGPVEKWRLATGDAYSSRIVVPVYNYSGSKYGWSGTVYIDGTYFAVHPGLGLQITATMRAVANTVTAQSGSYRFT